MKRAAGKKAGKKAANRAGSAAWDQMDVAALSSATKEFDAEFVVDRSKPMTAAERKSWAAAKRKPGRPRVGSGSKAVSVTIEEDLLKKADRLAKRLKVSRSQLIAQGLREVLKAG